MHIVHLEDEKSLQDILRLTLEFADPQISLQQFINSDRAMEYIQQNLQKIDLLILDIRVPGSMSGIQLAERVRGLKSSIPIILTSAYMQPTAELLALLSCEYITKPWQLPDFVERIRHFVR